MKTEMRDKHLQMYNEAMIRAVIADTIERCAQVAESYVDDLGDGYCPSGVAAAIRALKDKP